MDGTATAQSLHPSINVQLKVPELKVVKTSSVPKVLTMENLTAERRRSEIRKTKEEIARVKHLLMVAKQGYAGN